jgi:hypothetical protein
MCTMEVLVSASAFAISFRTAEEMCTEDTAAETRTSGEVWYTACSLGHTIPLAGV